MARPEHYPKIPFANSQHPHSGFDLKRLEMLASFKPVGHSPLAYHEVAFYLIIVLEEGKGKHRIDFQPYTYHRNRILLVRKGQLHAFENVQSLKGWMILFTEDFLVSYLEDLEARRTLQLFNDALHPPKVELSLAQRAQLGLSIARMEAEYKALEDPLSLSILRSQLHILITRLFRYQAAQNVQTTQTVHLERFLAFQAKAEANIMEHTNVQHYAQDLGVSTKTLNATTKAVVQQNAKGFLDGMRLMQIKRWLINSGDSVKEIAYRSGFSDPSNFNTFFKRSTGQTPEQFRASAQDFPK